MEGDTAYAASQELKPNFPYADYAELARPPRDPRVEQAE